MLSRRVIPCLDVAGGRVVKGTRFVELVDEEMERPLEQRQLVGLVHRAGTEGGSGISSIGRRV